MVNSFGRKKKPGLNRINVGDWSLELVKLVKRKRFRPDSSCYGYFCCSWHWILISKSNWRHGIDGFYITTTPDKCMLLYIQKKKFEPGLLLRQAYTLVNFHIRLNLSVAFTNNGKHVLIPHDEDRSLLLMFVRAHRLRFEHRIKKLTCNLDNPNYCNKRS